MTRIERSRSRSLLDSYWPLTLVIVAATVFLNLRPAALGIPEDLHTFLVSASAMRSGQDPYAAVSNAGLNLNLNVPGLTFATIPFSFLSLRAAVVAWILVSVAALVWSVRVVRRVTGVSTAVLCAWSLAALTGGFVLQVGQVTFLLMPLMTLAWLFDRRGRSGLSGALIGVLIYLKPFFALYVMYWLLRRDWKAVGAGLGVTVSLWAGTFAADREGSLAWLETAGTMGWQANPLNGSVSGVAARLFSYRLPSAPHYQPLRASPLMEAFVYLGGAAAILIATRSAIVRTASRDKHWAIVGLCALLTAPLGWPYYLPLFLGPLAASNVLSLSSALFALAIFSVPRSVILLGHYDVWNTLIAGCLPFWGMFLLWALTYRSTSSEQDSNATQPSPAPA